MGNQRDASLRGTFGGKSMSRVLVVDAKRRPLHPCTPARARLLLKAGRAAVLRRFPFTLVLKAARPEAVAASLRLKIDPGAKTTGLAVINDTSGEVVWAADLAHRGEQVQERLRARRAQRRSRRQRTTRYRPARFANRRRARGWLPPSLRSRMHNVLTWVDRLRHFCPIAALSLEVVTFDTQLLQDAEIQGVAYQQGELAGWEVRQYVLAKWHYRCAYCGKQEVPFELDHIVPRSHHGSDRVSNLALACHACNQAKGDRTAEEFGHPEVQDQAKTPLRGAAAVNATRWALYQQLQLTGLPLEAGSGGLTKWSRTKHGLPKAHWVDAANVGVSTPPALSIAHVLPWHIQAVGRQRRQMCLVDKRGFPRSKAKQRRVVHGFQTGDLVVATVTKGQRAGKYQGKVAVRASGYFSLTTRSGTVTDIAHRYCRLLQRSDGYAYEKGGRGFLPFP